jgi:Mrp family chromosome partitioning ATPase
MDERSLRSVGIVSATPGVGKSFVSANLAAALSRVPARLTYLFDFDLRRSSIAENFGISPEVGLNNYLAGKIDALSPVAHIPEGERLVILPSISDQTSSAELLAGGRCEALCEAFRSLPAGTLCICDLPPAFANDDAAIMSARLDAYLLVVEDGHSTRSQVKETIEMLSADKCIGAVLNNFNGGVISDHYGYGYGQTGKYSAYYGS